METPTRVRIASGICFNLKFSTFYSHINLTWPHTILASYWSRPIPTQRLPFIGHTLHPCNACSSLVTPHTHATFAFHWPRLTPTQGLFLESFCWFYLRPDVTVNICSVHRRWKWYVWPKGGTLTGTTTLSQSIPEGNGNEEETLISPNIQKLELHQLMQLSVITSTLILVGFLTFSRSYSQHILSSVTGLFRNIWHLNR